MVNLGVFSPASRIRIELRQSSRIMAPLNSFTGGKAMLMSCVLCLAILSNNVQTAHGEIFAFGIHDGYEHFNWTQITDIGFWSYPKPKCLRWLNVTM